MRKMRTRITPNTDIFYAVIFANIFTNVITEHLSYCIVFGEFPDELKCANTITVYKKNESYGKTNYRPVSIVTNISKIYETLMYNQLSQYFDSSLFTK